ncbi:MAG: aminotransferase class V-fold PLP-dependent enzyme [Treponema sp.]|nr:aminotransferase class V-fold PLP-dependent enzyme [Treponema sp.]
MYSFKDDYSELGHEKILNDLVKLSKIQMDGYGLDSVSADAKALIKKRFDINDADIHFISGGTQTNMIFCNSVLSPIDAVISADTGHINVHECGTVEHNGNKILTSLNKDGKILPNDIESIYNEHADEHMVRPKLVYISQSTEKGTIYKKQELIDLFNLCKKLNLYFFIDGARLAAALTCEGNDIKPEDMGKLCDAFYIGGTKNGSPLGEALCIINGKIKADFRYYLKQHGALLAKGALIGSCFKTLFTDDLYFENARRSNAMTRKIAKALIAKGYKMSCDSPANLILPILPNEKIAELKKHFIFHNWEKVDADNTVIRLVSSWATNEAEVDKLISMF